MLVPASCLDMITLYFLLYAWLHPNSGLQYVALLNYVPDCIGGRFMLRKSIQLTVNGILHLLPVICCEPMQHQRVMPHTQQQPFHLLLKTRLVWLAVHASGWTSRPGFHLTGSCCGASMPLSQTTFIAGWACSRCYAWYILHLTYVHVMLCCNCHLPLCEHSKISSSILLIGVCWYVCY